MGIPIQENCDMGNPEEFALWALVALPGPGGTAPLALPEEALGRWSKRLWDCGFRFHPDLQTVKYVPPDTGASFLEAPNGRWVGVDEVVEDATPDLSELSDAQKRRLLDYLKHELKEE